MKILDCESVDSTYESIQSILEVDRGVIDEVFAELNIEQFLGENCGERIFPEDVVPSALTNRSKLPGTFDQTCWFHLTRTFKGNQFENGLLPLPQIINTIYDFLFSLVRDRLSREQWNKFIEELYEDSFHRSQITGARGPDAFLIRDIAFRGGIHDYLRVPEIISDICYAFNKTFGFDLLTKFLDNTKPCIVKFSSDMSRAEDFRKAVYYIYLVHHGSEFGSECDIARTGLGTPIPMDQIVRIDFLE